MKCSEYQQQLLINPSGTDSGLAEHLQNCPTCAAYAKREAQFQVQLRDAVEIPIPEGLAPARLAAASFTQPSAMEHRIRPLLALAAGILLAVFMAGVLMPQFTDNLEVAVLAELAHDRDRPAGAPEIQTAVLRTVLEPVGVELRNGLQRKVMFAELCDVAKKKAVHIVMVGDIAPVSALLMPGQPVTARSTLDDGRITGILIPVPGGSLAIAGSPGEPIAQYENEVLSSLRIRRAGAHEL
jgi:anti-sigma factor RsiW